MTFLALLLRHRRIVIFVHLALALIFAPGVFFLKNDNSPSVYFARDALALQQYEQFRRDFGGGEIIRITLSGPGLWTKPGLTWLAELEKQSAAHKNVETVIGIAAQYQWQLLEWPPEHPAQFRKKILENISGFSSGWISKNGGTLSMLAVLKNISPAEKKQLVKDLKEITGQGTQVGIDARFSGLPVIHMAMDQSMLIVVSRFLPALVVLAGVFLLVIFKRLSSVLIPLSFVGVFNMILFGIIGNLREPLNMVSVIVAPLLFVIALAAAVHILVRFRQNQQQGLNPVEAVLKTYGDKAKPVLWTGITTCAAFGSLVFSGVPPVRWIGLWAGSGIIIMTILAFTLFPVLLAISKHKQKKEKPGRYETYTREKGRGIAHWAIKYRTPVLAVSAVVLIFAGIGITRIAVDDNIGKYFPERHEVRENLESLEKQGIGVFAAELVMAYPEGEDNFWHPAKQTALARLAADIRSLPLVYGAVSSGDLVEMSIKAMVVEGDADENMRWMTLGMLQTMPDSRKLLLSLVKENGGTARVTLLLPMRSFNKMQPLFETVKKNAGLMFPGARVFITGEYPLIILAQGKLLRGLIISLSITFLCVLVMFWLLVRSPGLTFRVIVPNLWPVVLLLGGMGWFGIPLDSASVMTVSIVLGLAVDDTFHTLGYYTRFLKRLAGPEAIESTLRQTAPAHILTSLILVAGFAVCSFSQFVPVARMGMVSAVAITLALIGDLIIIPAIIAKPSAASK